jgi:hypothetical protein
VSGQIVLLQARSVGCPYPLSAIANCREHATKLGRQLISVHLRQADVEDRLAVLTPSSWMTDGYAASAR